MSKKVEIENQTPFLPIPESILNDNYRVQITDDETGNVGIGYGRYSQDAKDDAERDLGHQNSKK